MTDGRIFWPAACGTDDDPGLFWDPNLSVNTSTPRVTACMQGVVVSLVGPAYLLIVIPFYLPYLICRPPCYTWRQKTALNWTKLLLSLLMVALHMGTLVRGLLQPPPQPLYTWLSPAVLIATYVWVSWLHHMEFRHGVFSSGILLFFWLISATLGIIPFIDLITQGSVPNTVDPVLLYIKFGIMWIQLCLVLMRDFGPEPLRQRAETYPLLGGSKTRPPSQSLPACHEKDPCPESRASFLSNLFHLWIAPLVLRGYRRPLQFEDFPDVLEREKCCSIYPLFDAAWTKHEPSKRSTGSNSEPVPALPLLRCLVAACWTPFVVSGIYRILFLIPEFLEPLFLKLLIDLVAYSDDPYYTWKGFLLGGLLLIANVFQYAVAHNYFKYCTNMAMHTRSAIIAAVYRKAMKLSNEARRHTTAGEIVNLMSVDAQKIYDNFFDIHELWVCTVETILAMMLLWMVVGPAALAGFGLLLVTAPISGYYLMHKFATIQSDQMKHKDSRLKKTNEILANILVLKMYAWEPSFYESANKDREKEINSLRKLAWLNMAISICWNCTPFLVSLVVFAVYVLISPDNQLTPQVAFVSMSVISILNWSTSFLSMFIGFAAQAYVSLRRITRMLQEDELQTDAVTYDVALEEAIRVDGATLTWNKSAFDEPTLCDISLKVKEGELAMVVGTVGAGKSSLLQALLGEMHRAEGSLRLRGDVAYVPQTAWIQNASLRDNILFGKTLNERRYWEVVRACALEPDLKMLPGGDQIEIGEKGVNLSGGQKHRVALARAVYQDRDIYLLDDPLSAVDAHVGKHIFEHVIGPSGLLRRKTRVLVTHGISYLPQADRIVVLKHGRITDSGRYKDLMSEKGSFAEFMQQYQAEGEETTKRRVSATDSDEGETSPAGYRLSRRTAPLLRRLSSRQMSRTSCSMTVEPEPKPVSQLIEEEEAGEGAISWTVLKDYVLSGGIGYFTIVIVLGVVYVAGLTVANIWLSMWSDDSADPRFQGHAQTRMRLTVYGLLGAVEMVAMGGCVLALYLGFMHASRLQHARLLMRILGAPMSFFDTTPLGRIVNRFSTDMDKLDATIPMFTRWWLLNVMQMVSVVVIIAYSAPVFLAFMVLVIAIFFVIQQVYIKSLRQMKRIESIRRSPIFINFDETLVGMSSIRAFRQETRFIAKNERLTDDYQVAGYPINIAQRLLGMCLNILGSLITFFAVAYSILQKDTISAGMAGLIIQYAIMSTWSFSMMIRGAAELETHMVSVERIQEYSRVEQEAPSEVAGTTPAVTWPERGVVQFEDLSVRYRPGLDLVLHGLSFTVHQGEKLAIVGRTGAGKSSVALALFRIIEAASGRILIDGRDISLLGLAVLRSRLTVIPQDPVLFSGSLRMNLDPFSQYSDKALWRCLELSHLAGWVGPLAAGLQHECGEAGAALSVGQRQLVCLARALLRCSQVLILDEATAAVDLETDELIQQTLRTAFKSATVLTVAHRLHTVLDYDRVLVLDEGAVKELAPPSQLLQDSSSMFAGMVRDAGLSGAVSQHAGTATTEMTRL